MTDRDKSDLLASASPVPFYSILDEPKPLVIAGLNGAGARFKIGQKITLPHTLPGYVGPEDAVWEVVDALPDRIEVLPV